MSLYRLLNTPLPCGYCGEERQATVQFKTGGEDNLEQYEAGTPVSVGHGMAVETPFAAHTEWYCLPCKRQRKSDETRGFYLALASLVTETRLEVMQPGWLFKKPVTAEMLTQRATEEAALMLTQPPAKYKHLFSRLEDYQLVLDNARLEHGTTEYNDFIERVNQLITEHLASSGWTQTGLIRRDLHVHLTPQATLELTYTS